MALEAPGLVVGLLLDFAAEPIEVVGVGGTSRDPETAASSLTFAHPTALIAALQDLVPPAV